MTERNYDIGSLETHVQHLKAGQERIEARLEAMHDAITSRLNDHSGRLRSLEVWRGWMAGVLALGGGIVGWVGKVLAG